MQDIRYENYRDKDTVLYFGYSENLICKKHFHRNFEMLYITKGEMTVEVNNKTFVAKEDDIVFVSNYYSHGYCVPTECAKYCLIVPSSMSSDFMSKFRNQTLPSLLSDKTYNRKIRAIMESQDFETLPALAKKGYVLVIFGLLLDHYPKEDIESNADIDSIVSILDYIDRHYAEELSLDSISKYFGYNKYYFSKRFHHYIGENLTSYINIIRLQHLMEDASRSAKPNIAKLAYENGFDSLATFYRYFSKVYGTSPVEYLSQIREKNEDFSKVTD